MTRISLAALGVAASLLLSSPRPAFAGEASAAEAPSAGARATTPPAAVTAAADALAAALAVEEGLVKAIASVRESSVSVFHLKKGGGGDLHPAGMGSGVVHLSGGKPYVLTNEHVIQGADAIQVRVADGTTYPVKVKDRVPRYDIALLEFTGKTKALKGARIGRTPLHEGQWVVATGNPFFLATDGQPVATLGVVSGLDRILPGQFNYPNAIQHDAEVNPGNSGGPLWNLDGELVGINGKIATRSGPAAPNLPASNTGASFSIPIQLVNVYLRTLLDDKVAAAAGYTGLTVETTTVSGKPLGAKVTKIATDCPCAHPKSATGLKVGDLLVRVVHGGRDHEVRTATDYENLIATLAAGADVRLVFLRDGKRLTWGGKLSAAK